MKKFTRLITGAGVILLAALFMASSGPAVSYAIERGEYESVYEEAWYDPSDWFERGGGIDYETDWYEYTYNYDVSDGELYGYYGEDEFAADYPYDRERWYGGYHYYTDEWFRDKDVI